MKKLLLFLLLITQLNNYSQSNYWGESKNKIDYRQSVDQPLNFKQYDLNTSNLLSQLAYNTNSIIELPNENGEYIKFTVFEKSNFAPELVEKYPEIKSFIGKSVKGKSIANISYSPSQGLNVAITNAGKPTTLIKPIKNGSNTYIVFSRNEISLENPFECEDLIAARANNTALDARNVNDGFLRKYRLAVSTTAEFSQFWLDGTEASDIERKTKVIAALNTTLTRINGIFERDFSITMELIGNNDQVVYLDTATDPYSGVSNSILQTTLDNVIGDSNYDVGHLFHFESQVHGNAGCIACVCTSGSKGSGWTGHSAPDSDNFNLIASHELGHQFGGYHVQSSSNCRSSAGLQEVEPGSGSTIMGYAGICPANVQSGPDDYFNYVDIRDVNQWTRNDSSCAQLIVSNNTEPIVNAGNDFTIPKSTAFILEGTGSDTDGDAITFCWEENDPENPNTSNAPLPTRSQGPMFRSKLPVGIPIRYMPQLSDVVSGNLTPTWEVLPSISRTMDFVLTVRDNHITGAQTASDEMTVTVDSNAGPFTVTSQLVTETWNVGDNISISWDVANTDQTPINATNVDVLLSIDGGFTYPYTIASNLVNNGSTSFFLPNIPSSTQGRFMVKASNNIFYAINSADINIQTSEFVMNFTNNHEQACRPNDIIYNFTYNTFLSFSETTVFSTVNLPTGASITFNPSSATVDGTIVQATISNTSAIALGEHNFVIKGIATSVEKNTDVSLNVFDATIANPNLTNPTNGETTIDPFGILNWDEDINASSYDIEIATDNAFANSIETSNVSINEYQASNLDYDTTYYWRVKSTNECGTGSYSNVYSFTTFCIAPSNINVTNVVLDSATVNWTENGNATSWEIEVVEVGQTATGTGISVGINPYTITGLNSLTEYIVYVRSSCGSGNFSDWTASNSFTTAADFCSGDHFYDTGGASNPYSNGENIITTMAPSFGNNTIVVTFNSFNLESGYDYLRVYDGSDTNAPQIGTFSGSTIPGPFTSNNPNGTLTFWFTSDGSEIRNGWDAAVTCLNITCPTPTNFIETNVTGNSIDLSWTVGNTESSWEIEYGTTGFIQGLGTTVQTSTNPFTLTGLSSSTTYDFYLRANCGVNPGDDDSLWIGPITETTLVSCSQPTNLTAINAATSIDLSWINGSTETSWEIEYGTTGFTQGLGTTVQTSTNPYSVTGLNPNTTYDFYLRANCGVNPGDDDSLWVGPITSLTLCDTFSTPYLEDVEAHNGGSNIQNCWSATPNNTTNYYHWEVAPYGNTNSSGTGPSQANSGSKFFYTEASGSYNTGDVAELITPLIDISNLTVPQLTFYNHMYGYSIGSLHIDVLNNGNWTNDLLVINGEQHTSGTAPWTEQTLVLSAFTGEIQIRFRGVRGTDYHGDIAIDDIQVIEAPTCPKPSSFTTQNISINGVDLNWIAGNVETNWEIEYGTAGFTPGLGTTVQTTMNSYSFTGLNPNTTYDFYLRANCGVNPGDDDSLWTFVNVTTLISCPVPYNINTTTVTYNSAQTNWNTGGSESNWEIEYGFNGFTQGTGITVQTTTNSYTFTGLNNSTSYQYYIKANCGINSGDDDSNWVGPFYFYTQNLPRPTNLATTLDQNTGQVTLTWDASNYDSSGDFVTYYIYRGGALLATSATTTYLDTLPVYGNYYYYVTAKYNQGESNSSNTEYVLWESCPTPSNFVATNPTTSTIDLSWIAGNTETIWEIEYGSTGFVQGQGTIVQVNSNPFTLTGISSSTNYDIYLRAVCGIGDESNWIGSISFSTLCDTFIAPFTEDFTSFSTPNCWVESGSESWKFNTNAAYAASNAGDHTAGGGTNYAWIDGSSPNGASQISTLTSPMIDISVLTIPQVSFSVFSLNSTNNNYNTLDVEFFDGANWNMLLHLQNSNGGWTNYTYVLSNYTIIGDIQLRFTIAENSPSQPYNNDILIDDVSVDEAPSCPQPTSFSQTNSTPNSIDLSWMAGNTETSWEIEYGAAGFTHGNGTSVSATTNPYTLTGLSAETNYDVYVKAICGLNPGDDDSLWIGPINFTTQVSCPQPTSFSQTNVTPNSIDLSWIAGNSETTWEIEYGAAGFTHGNGISISATTNPYTLTGLSAETNYDVYVKAICGVNPDDDDSLWVGSINFTTQVSCPIPSNFVATNPTTSTIDLSWVAGNSETTWEIEYGAAGFVQGQGTIIQANSNPFTLTGISSSTNYDIYLRAVCGIGDESNWIGSISFSTLCNSLIAPFTEDFTSFSTPNCWIESGSESWRFNTNAAYAASNAGDHTSGGGTNYAWIDGSVPSGASQISTLTSPTIDISGLTIPQVSFSVFSLNSTDNNYNTLDVEFFDGANWNTLLHLQNSNGGWTNYTYVLSNYTIIDDIQLRFTIAENSPSQPYNNDILIDDVSVGEAPSCPQPISFSQTNITPNSIDLSWIAGNSETTWEIEYGAAGFTHGNGTSVSATTNSYTLTGLSAETNYDVYVKAVCGVNPGDDDSLWVGPLNLTTLSLVRPYNLTADLDNVTGEVLLNWNQTIGFNDEFDNITSWIPVSGNWNLTSGNYSTSSVNQESSSYYNEDFSNFEYEVKLRKTSGSDCNLSVYFNGDPTSTDSNGYWDNGYQILYCTTTGSWILTKMVNGVWTNIKDWSSSSNLNLGLNSWNTIKVNIANGYIDVRFNDVLQGTYFDNTFTTGKVGIGMADSSNNGTAEFDFAYLSSMITNYNFGIVTQNETRKVYDSFPCNNCSIAPINIVTAPTPILGLNYAYENLMETSIFQNYKIYRDGIEIGTSISETYLDQLPAYGDYDYYVASIYDEGESLPSNTVTVNWHGTPNIVVNPLALTQTLYTNQTATQTVSVTNNGDDDLNFTINSSVVTTNYQNIGFGNIETENLTPYVVENSLEEITVTPTFSKRTYFNTTDVPNILVYEDTSNQTYYIDALVNLGYTYTQVSSWSLLESTINDGTNWDLVIANSYNTGASTTVLNALDTYQSNGGSLIFADWRVDNNSSHSLFSNMGISYVSNITTPINFSALNTNHNLFNFPNQISSFNWSNDQFPIDGQIVDVINGAFQLAAFDGNTLSGAIVLNASKNCIFNAFQSDNFQLDDNANGKTDIIELLENEINFLAGSFWLSTTQTSGTVAAGSTVNIDVNFDSTDLAVGTYNGNIEISSNDPDEPIVNVTAELIVIDNTNSINDLSKYNFKYYPNPFENSLNLSATENFTSVKVFSLLGQELIHIIPDNESSLSIDMSKLNVGTYFMKVEIDGKSSSMKIIKK